VSTYEKHFAACENCEGAGGWVVSVDGAMLNDLSEYDERWVECPACDGLGWVEADPEPLTQRELDARSV
jgi:hypothetical protein